jgi:hypothetical protein
MSDTVDEPLTEEPVEPEEPVAEEPVASEAVEPEEPVVEEAVEEEAVEEEPVEPEPEPVVIEQVASDIREILTPISLNDELSSDFKKRLGYLTYFFDKVVEYDICRPSKKRKLYLLLKQGYTGTVDTVDVLDGIEKKLELVKKYIQGDTISIKNYRYKLSEYTVDKSLLNDKTILEKIELLELICSKITKFIYSSMDQKSLIEELDLLC